MSKLVLQGQPILIPKPDKTITRKEKYRSISNREGHSTTLTSLFIFTVFVFGCTGSYLRHVGSSSLTRVGTGPPALDRRVIATRPPGKSS